MQRQANGRFNRRSQAGSVASVGGISSEGPAALRTRNRSGKDHCLAPIFDLHVTFEGGKSAGTRSSSSLYEQQIEWIVLDKDYRRSFTYDVFGNCF
jgi:hypothetical protein